MITMDKMEVPFNELSESRQLEIVGNYMDSNEWWHEFIIENYENSLREHGFSDNIEINFSGFWSQGDGASFTASTMDVRKFIEIESKKGNLTYTFEDGWVLGEESLDPLLEMALEDLSEDGKVDSVYEAVIKGGWFEGCVMRDTFRYYHEKTVSSNITIDYWINDDEDGDTVDDSTIELTKPTYHEVEKFKDYLAEYLDNWVVDKCKEIYRALETEWEAHHAAQLESLKEENSFFIA